MDSGKAVISGIGIVLPIFIVWNSFKISGAENPAQALCSNSEIDEYAGRLREYSNQLFKYYSNYSKNINSSLNHCLINLKAEEETIVYYQAKLKERIGIVRSSHFETEASGSKYLSELKLCGEEFWEKSNCFRMMACTSSMKPVFSCKNALIIYNEAQLKIGDVIAFNLPAHFSGKDDYGKEIEVYYYAHRIISINGTRYVTKGDNNWAQDEYQPSAEDVIGKVKVIIY